MKPKDCYVLKNKQLLSNVVRIQNLGSYRIICQNGYFEMVSADEIQIVRSCLTDQKSNNIFEYLKQIAYTLSLRTHTGSNKHGSRYSKIGDSFKVVL